MTTHSVPATTAFEGGPRVDFDRIRVLELYTQSAPDPGSPRRHGSAPAIVHAHEGQLRCGLGVVEVEKDASSRPDDAPHIIEDLPVLV